MNNNPAFGADLEPFMGISSFMRLPVTRNLKDVDVAVMGVPFDSGTSYRSGTRFGPRKIRETSLMIWGHNSTLNVSPLKQLNVVDYGDVSVIPTSIEHTMSAITKTAGEIIKEDTTLITLSYWSMLTHISTPGNKNLTIYPTAMARHFDTHCKKA